MNAMLEGKRALVTGASRGLGRAIALALARAGAQVVAHYYRHATEAQALCREIQALGREAECMAADLADARAGEKLAEQLTARDPEFRLDLLVNNAGLWRTTPLGTTEISAVDELLAVNLRSAFLVTQALLQWIPAGGAIVNISSVAARQGVAGGRSLYGATKAALDAFTRNWALELAPRGIRVNAVAPGYLRTEMTAAHFSNPAMLERALARHPFGRMATPEEVAAAVVFLASPAAAAITGQIINTSAGFII